jgi:2-oxoglutarate ferredoxin oxidoreductase subunit beta
MLFNNGKQGIRLDGFTPQVVDLEGGRWGVADCLVYDETSRELAGIAGQMFWQPDMPRPFGVFYKLNRPTYEEMLHQQIAQIIETRGKGDLAALLNAGDTWEVK